MPCCSPPPGLLSQWCEVGAQTINSSSYYNGRGITSMPPYIITTRYAGAATHCQSDSRSAPQPRILLFVAFIPAEPRILLFVAFIPAD